MFLKLFLAFTVIPVCEIYLLIHVGGIIGAFNTVAVVLITGGAGAYLARLEGMNTMLRVRESLRNGVMPAEELVDALLILVAGIVLLTPGFITDAAGIVLLIPFTRRHVKRWLRRIFDRWISGGRIVVRRYP